MVPTPFSRRSIYLASFQPLLLLRLDGPALDHMADISHGQLQREIHAVEHLREEDPPTGHAREEAERTAGLFI